ncbi:MAG TPA: hypothetical protein VG672_26810, partial [Bryobacteraceae bacterium]|nr:hypothetical protein [Bryobacteraceae bacterium]
MRALVLAWLAAGSLLAQFQDLATPDDGSVLYFSSSLRLSGSTQFLFAKLFRMDATGIHLYAQQAPGASLGRTTENFYLLTAPDVSADGTVLAYTASRPCSGGSGCIPVEQHQGHIVGAGQTERVAAGYVRISRNGRYALYFGMTAIFPTPATQLIDLQSGAATTVPYMIRPSGARRRIAFDGTVLATSDDSLVLWRKSGTETLSNSHAAADAMVNDAATLVVYQSTGPDSKLIAYDVRSGAETVLAELSGDDPASFGASMTGDGSLVLFLDRGQVYLVHSDGSGLRRLSDDPAGIVEAILTGNGQFVYAVTGEGRMIRIGTGSGEVLELVSRTPNITSVEQAVSGTLVRVTGTALAAASAAGTSPLPDTLAGVGIKLGGVPMPLALVTPTEILWQVPWEWPAGATPFQLLSGSSP